MKRTRQSLVADGKHSNSSYNHQKTQQDERDVRRRKRWNEDSEEYLIQLWYHNVDILRGNRRTGDVYEEFAKEMASEGYHFTAVEIQCKLHNLTNKYKLEKRKLAIEGGISEWRFYSIVDKIYKALRSDPDETLENRNKEIEEEEDTRQYYNEDSMLSAEEIDNPVKKIEIESHKDESFYSNEEVVNDLKPVKKSESAQKQSRPKRDYNREILEMLKNCQDIMQTEAEERKKSDAKMLQLQRELVAIEKERNEILKELLA
ncbi:uncharacterized protein LOC101893981 [Musca domestica]|uniref:Uncharacterized protein LOC101893981 n=1 Tax=Musca domestica TaxID=7370 RepID=A0A1I8N4V8_MUSDO|nr:uncharacterized protein LOC101893981 [Musca domestica]